MQSHIEAFKETVAHKKHEKILFYADFTEDLKTRVKKHYGLAEDADLKDHFEMFDPLGVSPEPPDSWEKPDFSRYFKGVDIPQGAFINHLGVLEIPGSMYHFTRYISPLRDAAGIKDMESFPFPNYDGYRTDHMKTQVEEFRGQGRLTCCRLTHMYEDSWQIRGYEEFLMDLAASPEICEFILDKVTERNLFKTKAAALAGVDMLVTGDDVANQRSMMFSVEHWRRFMKPRWAKVYALAKSIKPDIQIWYHSDGNIEQIIPELIEIGVSILNPVQPECLDPVTIKRKYGNKIVLDGTIGTQTTMPFSTPDEVAEVVKQRIRDLGQDGALILSPTHILEPEVPIENIEAFIRTAKEFSVG